jgi:3-deoxy-manno-octulosonate cytidylyltransferase (CMP-KDO synthetase)
VVATDDERIFQTVTRFGGRVRMTRADHLSGTDRVAEVAESTEGDVFVNIQGDEPGISPLTIEAVCAPFEEGPEVQITTARVEISSRAEVESPDVVKVVVDRQDRALYFSRSVIPSPQHPPANFYKHLGIYGYRRDSLLKLARLRPSSLERVEGLEQLRFLEEGFAIRVVQAGEECVGVDTAEDVERVRPFLENVGREHEE